MKIKFVEGNTVPYFVDNSFCKGIPSDSLFEVSVTVIAGRRIYDLRAPGYGKYGDYGDGNLRINETDITRECLREVHIDTRDADDMKLHAEMMKAGLIGRGDGNYAG